MLKLGNCVQWDSALQMMHKAGISPATLLDRHARGDHGELPLKLTDEDLADCVASFYLLWTGDAIWVCTGILKSELVTSMVGFGPEEIEYHLNKR